MAEYKTKLLIIGSGPAGYTAGIYAARAGLSPVLVSGFEVGGQLTLSEDVSNFPGFVGSVRGPDLMETMRQQVLNLGVTMVNDIIVEVDFAHRPFECSSENHNAFYADAVLIATGASAKWLNVAGEDKFRGFGVSVCATCDGFFYKNKHVAVVGGGNSAAEEAIYLTNFVRSVTIVHRREQMRADKALLDQLAQNHKINIKYNCVVEEVLGQDNPKGVTGLKLKNVRTDKKEILDVSGVFVAIGHKPNTDVFKNHLELDKDGYIKTTIGTCKTSIPGIFASGDVQNPHYRQAIIAAGSGAIGALEAERFLNKRQD